jgi:sorting nexin-1/2
MAIPDSSSKAKPAQSIDTSTGSLKSPTARHPRTPRRAGAQTVRLEALDDSLGPLGPLGDNATTAAVEQPPVPPQKEQTVTHNVRQPSVATQSPIGRSILDPIGGDEVESSAGPRIPPPVQPALASPTKRDIQPSVSIEQAAKPTFDISVGDPHKVGDLTSSHIVYLVKTKVRRSCTP